MRSCRVHLPIFASFLLAACAPGSSPGGGDSDGSDGADGSDDNDNGDGFIDAGFGGFIDAGGQQNGDGGGNQNGAACDKIDILFVVDNSGSMEQEQQNLAANFPAFASQIDEYRNSTGQPLDYHVAVTTTDVGWKFEKWNLDFGNLPETLFANDTFPGNDGAFVTSGNSSCNFPAGRKFLQKGDADFATKLSCALTQGIDGSATERPLEAARAAVVDRVSDGTNAGFLRPDALLAVVILTDEEDCSGIPPLKKVYNNWIEAGLGSVCDANSTADAYAKAFDAVKGGQRGKWATAIIAGETNCSSDFGDAAKAQRLLDFATQTGDNAVFSSICTENLSGALSEAFDTFSLACENIPPG
jgi:hypothetical protein